MARIDLHLHTTHSDGSLPPAEVLARAHQAGVTALSITDHDILDGIGEAVQAAASLGIEVIPGLKSARGVQTVSCTSSAILST